MLDDFRTVEKLSEGQVVIAPYWVSLGGKSTIYCAGGYELLGVTVTLCIGVAVCYFLIAKDWYKRERACKSERGKSALRDLRIIFIWCAVAGYISRIVLSLYPAWTLYLLSLVWLNYISWRYYSKLSTLDIVYNDAEKLESVQTQLRQVRRYNDIVDIQERLRVIEQDLTDHLENY